MTTMRLVTGRYMYAMFSCATIQDASALLQDVPV